MTNEEEKELMNREYISYKTGRRIEQKPRYLHDCMNCKFFGQYYGYDLWACIVEQEYPNPAIIKTLIARYGEEGKYYSGISCMAKNKPILECFCRVYDFYSEGRIILEHVDYRGILRVIREMKRNSDD